MEENKSNSKKIRSKIKRRVRLGMILLAAVIFSFNSVAWFIYSNMVESGIGAKVKAWNVYFEVDGEERTEYIDLNVDSIYPGMQNFHKDIIITNLGDTNANLEYQVLYANVLGDNYSSTENDDITDEFAEIKEQYPFIIDYEFNKNYIEPDETAAFAIDISWPFESGDDEKDTLWGGRAYDFAELHPSSASISIRIKIKVVQEKEETE